MTALRDYVPLSASAAQALHEVELSDFELFLPPSTGKEPVLYRRAGIDLSSPDYERVRDQGIPFLYVRLNDFERLGDSLESRLANILSSDRFEPGDKVRLAHQVGTSVAQDLISYPQEGADFTRTARLVDTMIDGLVHDPVVGSYLVHMAGHDLSTAGHMYMVSMLAVLLGAEIFGPDRRTLHALGLAGMLHDLGKLSIPSAILLKPGPLTQDEVQCLQQHPIESVRLIGDDPNVSDSVRRMIVQHHERLDGGGYPLGLVGAEVLDGTKVLTIVDSFHALIGQRSYCEPVTPPVANRILAEQEGQQFDPDYLATWLALFERSAPMCNPNELEAEPVRGNGLSARHEHRKTPPPPKVVGSRAIRFSCRVNAVVRCVYAGRLRGVSAAGDEFQARVLNVSRAGLCLATAHPVYRGETLHVCIEADNVGTWVQGFVAWCRARKSGGFRVGLRLVHRLSEHEAHSSVPVRSLIPD